MLIFYKVFRDGTQGFGKDCKRITGYEQKSAAWKDNVRYNLNFHVIIPREKCSACMIIIYY